MKKISLDPPASVVQSTQKYRDDNNSVGQWIDAACFLDANLRTIMKDLHDPIAHGARALEPLHNTLFGKELTRLGYQIFKAKKGNGRIGIGLKQPSATTDGVAGELPCL